MPDIAIRPARPAEAEALTELVLRSKAYWGYDAAFMAACRRELTVAENAIQDGMVYVATDGDDVLGLHALRRLSDARIELDLLFVEPAHIGTGVGRKLMGHAMNLARAMGGTVLEIHADPNAVDFYRAAGGRLVGESPSGSIAGRALPVLEIDLV